MDAGKLGSFIAQMRKENHLTQAQLAEKLHVTDKAVSRWERGLGYPDMATMEPLAQALGISLTELMMAERKQEVLITKDDADTAIGNTVDVSRSNGRKKLKRVLTCLMIPCILLCIYWSMTGFMTMDNVALVDYSVLNHQNIITLQVGVTSSIGYTRSYRIVEETEERIVCQFYSTFGGLNSSFGAHNTFILNPQESVTEICFIGYEKEIIPVLKKVNGEWISVRDIN